MLPDGGGPALGGAVSRRCACSLAAECEAARLSGWNPWSFISGGVGD